MSYLLRIDTSPRDADSQSRALADRLEPHILQAHGLSRVMRVDVAERNLPHIAQDTITGFYTPPEAMTPKLEGATALSDALIAELKSAGALLISAPIYNFSLPSSLKAWVDQVVRIGHTFSYDGQNFGGLLPADHAYLALAYGSAGYEPGGPMRAMDHLEPYLRDLMTFLGIGSVEAFRIQGTTGEPDAVSAAQARLANDIATHFAA